MTRKKRINVGIIGLGRAGWDMICGELDKHKREYTVVAACDIMAERREKFEERYKSAATYNRYQDLVKDPQVELVVVASRSCDHAIHSIAGLKADKDVFVEKPMCETCAEAKKMRQAATRSKGSLYVRHNRRFEVAFMHIREIIKSGILGKIFQVKLRRNEYCRRNDWLTLKKFGGGQLLSWGPHIIDHALRLLESPCRELWCDLKQTVSTGDTEDHVKVLFRGENDRIVDMEISCGYALPESAYFICGSKGALECSGDKIHLRYLDPRKKQPVRRLNAKTPQGPSSEDKLKWIEKTITAKAQGPDSKKDIWGHLYGAIRERKKFPISLDEAIEVMEVISKVRRKAKKSV